MVSNPGTAMRCVRAFPTHHRSYSGPQWQCPGGAVWFGESLRIAVAA